MFGVGLPEIVLILVLVLLLLGPDRLPGAARGIGRAMRELRRAGRELEDVPEIREIRDAMSDVQRETAETIRREATIDDATATPVADAAPAQQPSAPDETTPERVREP